MEPLLEYIEQGPRREGNDYVTVILPEFVPARWWQHLLHTRPHCSSKARCSSGRTSSSQRAVPSLEMRPFSYAVGPLVTTDMPDSCGVR
jgi:hypothetical protein